MSSSETPKWKVVENVVAAIERSLNTAAGANVIRNASIQERISGVPRQVDVYVEIPTGPRRLRIGIEVRDKSVALDLPEIEQLIAKLTKLDIDYGCIVSRAGFSATAKKEAARSGIELKTIAEVEHPDWWLVSALQLNLRKVVLLHSQLNFRQDEIAQVTPALADISATDLELTMANGINILLSEFVLKHGMKVLNLPEFALLSDQDTFALKIDFSGLAGATLQAPSGPVPLPQNIHALFRLNHRIENVRLAAYRGEDVTAFTGESVIWKKQITMVTKLNPDGTRNISVAMDDPDPKKTSIGRRG